MKRFRFQLEPVKNFKEQRMDLLLTELSELQGRVRAQEQEVEMARTRLADFDAECTQRKEEGMTILEAIECETSQQVLLRRLQDEEEALQKIRMEAERKRAEVVEARKEVHVLERLEEIRRQEYDKAAAKAEEKMIDDLVASRRVMDNAS